MRSPTYSQDLFFGTRSIYFTFDLILLFSGAQDMAHQLNTLSSLAKDPGLVLMFSAHNLQ